jgi:hypothetical protein
LRLKGEENREHRKLDRPSQPQPGATMLKVPSRGASRFSIEAVYGSLEVLRPPNITVLERLPSRAKTARGGT